MGLQLFSFLEANDWSVRIAVILAGSSLRCEANGSLLECERAASGEIDRQLWAVYGASINSSPSSLIPNGRAG